ncbi:hypothetical protein ACFLW6_01400 [Chloroflexota bacterium]
MKKVLALVLALVMVLSFAAPVLAIAPDYYDDLVAGRAGDDVGQVVMYVSGSNLDVGITLAPEWHLVEVHAHVECDQNGDEGWELIPQNKNHNPKNGQFVYYEGFYDPEVTPGPASTAFSLDISGMEDDLTVAIHCVVALEEEVDVWVYEGAWAKGTEFNVGEKNFAQYVVILISR